jgi:hydroxymethylpyrimidine kinase/phosphomethylpyrimidine kinase
MAPSAPRPAVPRVLSIAGTDPSGGAGIQADLKSIAAAGGYGMAAVTALVAQNTTGVRTVHAPPPAFLREQLDAVSDDVTIDAVKIGMLFDGRTAAVVRDWLDDVRPPHVVLDPVMVATSGDRLLQTDAEHALRELLGAADLVTPNVPELAILLDEPAASSWPDVLDQARRLARRHGVRVLAKGGHLESREVRDALVEPDGEVREFVAPRVDTACTHGTGCSLSAATATYRVRLGSWELAVQRAKRWLTTSIEAGADLRVGRGRGPVSHFAELWDLAGTHAGDPDRTGGMIALP